MREAPARIRECDARAKRSIIGAVRQCECGCFEGRRFNGRTQEPAGARVG